MSVFHFVIQNHLINEHRAFHELFPLTVGYSLAGREPFWLGKGPFPSEKGGRGLLSELNLLSLRV